MKTVHAIGLHFTQFLPTFVHPWLFPELFGEPQHCILPFLCIMVAVPRTLLNLYSNS
jgi:hypothetical protein